MRFLSFFIFPFLLSSTLYAFNNYDCENENSPFLIEIGYDTATVLNKKTFEVEKILSQVSSPALQKVKYESEGGDWTLELSKNRSVALLSVGDSDETVPFSCPEE